MAQVKPTYDFPHKTTPMTDEYDIDWVKKLGTGVSGPVRSCVHKATKTLCALKCLVDSSRARLEVKLHLQCSGHPHVVPAREVFVNHVQIPGDTAPKSRLLVVMEFMSGGELFDRIKAKRSFTELEASDVMKQITSAVGHLHSQNIAHRDLKPENLLLQDKSEKIHIALTDFGFAKIDNGTLQTPQFTPYYVAPQVLEAQRRQQVRRRGGQPSPYTYDKSCDIWSIGVIMYIMLCGYPPFYSESPTKPITSKMKHRITAGQYEFPHREWANVSPEAKDLIRRCLDVDTEQRITITEMQKHPWLCETVPAVELCSPSIMLAGEEAMFEATVAHGAQLREMRIDTNTLQLKPLGEAKNRLINRSRAGNSAQPGSVAVDSECLQALRDLLAFLAMPPPLEAPEVYSLDVQVVNMVQGTTIRLGDQIDDFNALLRKHNWNGNGFDQALDRPTFIQDLTLLVQKIRGPST